MRLEIADHVEARPEDVALGHAKGEVVADRRTYVGLAPAMLATLPGLAAASSSRPRPSFSR